MQHCICLEVLSTLEVNTVNTSYDKILCSYSKKCWITREMNACDTSCKSTEGKQILKGENNVSTTV